MKAEDYPLFQAVQPELCINGKVRKLQRLTASVYDAVLRPYGLQGSQLNVLFAIGKRGTAGVTQKIIASELTIDQSTLSREIKRLIDRGLVKNTKGEDARETLLSLSKEGFALVEKVIPVWNRTNEEVGKLLGSFNVQILDGVAIALQSQLEKLKKME
jgi:DNA-binding MarR family transcriptional regulator